MDFGSFLRQRQQKHHGSSNSGNSGSNSQDSWRNDRPFSGIPREDRQMKDSVFFDGPPEVDTWNHPDPYQQDVDCFDSGPAVHEPYLEPGPRGSKFHGRALDSSSLGRGRAHSSFQRGFGPEMEDIQTPGPFHASFGQRMEYDDEGGYFQNSCGNDGYESFGRGYGKMKGRDENFGPRPLMDIDIPDSYSVRGEKGHQNTDTEKEEDTSNDNQTIDKKVEVKTKPPKEQIMRTDEEKKALEEFDIMKVNINWSHFLVTNRMLVEASCLGKQPISSKKNYDVSRLEFYCKLCDVQTVSAGNLYDHMCGKKHKLKAEQEVPVTDAKVESGDVKDDENTRTLMYGGAIGFEFKDSNDQESGEIEDKKTFKKDNSYEKQFYENFDMSVANIDWDSCGITKSMLNEASFQTKVPKLEDRCYDIFNLHFYCKLCDIQSTSTSTFHAHLTGRKHKNKVVKDMNPDKDKDNKGSGEDAVADENQLSEKENNILQDFDIFEAGLNWSHYNITRNMLIEASTDGIPGVSQKKGKKKEIDLNKLEFYCKLCASQMVSAGNFYDHLVGKKHKTAFQEHMKHMANPEDNPSFLKPEELGESSILKKQMSCCAKPAIGLNDIIELQSIYHIWCICHLCGVKFPSKFGTNHILGLKHRLLYLRKNAPDNYKTLKNMHERNIPFYNQLDKFTSQREENEGCGKPSIKLFQKQKQGDGEKDSQATTAQDYIQWVNSEFDDCKAIFCQQMKDRPLSPIFQFSKNTRSEDQVDDGQGSFGTTHALHNRPSNRGNSPPSIGRYKRTLLPDPMDPYEVEPPYPNLLPPHHDLLQAPFRERDPYFRDRYLDTDPLLRERYMERDPLVRDRYLHRDPFLRERYIERKPDVHRERDPLRINENMDRGPYFDSDPLYKSRPDPYGDPLDVRNRTRQVDHYMGSESMKRRPDPDLLYLDPDPLKRSRKPEAHLDPNPLNRSLKSDPYIDPDPLKRVLPSQKAKAKPVVIDYGHGKEEKSEKSKAKEWEDDINDILDSGRKSKGPDSLALLSSSYSSPKREKSPHDYLPVSGKRSQRRKEKSPPAITPTKPLPFERSYMDRVDDFDIHSRKSRQRKRRSDSSYSMRNHSRSPEYLAKNPDHPKFRRGYDRNQPSPPLKISKRMSMERISISSESPPGVDSTGSKGSASSKNTHRYVKSPKFKRKSGSISPFKKHSRSSSRSGSSSRSSSDSPPRSSKYMRPKSFSRPAVKSRNSYSKSSPPRQSYIHHALTPRSRSPKKSRSPSGSLTKSLPSVPPPRSRSPFRSSRRSRSPSGPLPKSISSESFSRSRRSRSPSGLRHKSNSKSKSPTWPLPKSAPLPPLPPSLPPGPPPKPRSPVSRHTRSKSPIAPLPTSLPPQPPPRPRSPSKPSWPKNPPLPPSSPPSSERIPSPPARKEPKSLAIVDNADEDAQAERIANMLLNMKSSIVGSEMDDPHATLQALLSSKELTDALLATRAEPIERKDVSHICPSSSEPVSEKNRSPTLSKKAQPKSTSSRQKVAFAFAGKISGPSRNVPQTFLEEESSEEND